MSNHWHLIVWVDNQPQLSTFAHWFTGTHAQRWHAAHGTSGTGSVYQGRFKSIAIGSDRHFLAATRYVERNALAAGVVSRAEDWRWCSLWRHCNNCHAGILHPWPVPKPECWLAMVNEP